MPELNRFYLKHREDPFAFIGINADEREDKVKNFINDYDVKFQIGIDKEGRIQKLFIVTGFPTTIFIGADGTVHIYEVGPIMNADIAFDSLYKIGLEIIKTGMGITKEAYLQKLIEQKDLKPAMADDKEEEKDKLTGRAKEIAEKMDYPCGCSDKVMGCSCKTAKNIKEALSKKNLNDKTDAEIIKELNKEFCVKDDKG